MKNSKIGWTHHTFNPWMGCTKVSSGCANCYAETLMDTRWKRVSWGRGNPRQRTSAANWLEVIKWDREAKAAGERRRVFCASLADVFDSEVPKPWRSDLFGMIRQTQNLDWLILTKRIYEAVQTIRFNDLCSEWAITWPGNTPIWLGTSVENQELYNERIGGLMHNPAPIGFLSCEPLLGPIDLGLDSPDNRKAIDWVIVGGES